MKTRRTFLQGTLAAGVGAFAHGAEAISENDRILVAFELSGGNDGLNTIVPYGDDAYYRHRPTIGIKGRDTLKLDDHWGMNPGLVGMHRLWQDGQLAIMHGCGYERPSFSHFTSMAYWHTAAPNSGDRYGWMGRLADALSPEARANFLINIDTAQSLAVASRIHTPVVFDDPRRFRRMALHGADEILNDISTTPTGNPARDYLNEVARSATLASRKVREAWRSYRTTVDYGIAPSGLDKVAACIHAGLPTRLYYVAFRNNAFDTHVQQPNLHRRLLTYASDALHGFLADMARIGMADRVVVMVFSEFGRRVGENANLGTDHGTANTMLLAGKPVRGGHYGAPPDLEKLDDTDNILHTTDFRRVYATATQGWLSAGNAGYVLKGDFQPFDVFA